MAFKAKRNHTVAQKEIENGKALVDAALSGDLEEVEQLLNDGTSVDADDYNRSLFYKSQNYMTPLLCAASKGQTSVLKLLIDSGAALDSCDRFDVTAVHLAAENGHLTCLQILLDNGAECNMATKYSKHGSYTDYAMALEAEEEEEEEDEEELEESLGAPSPLHIHMQVLSLQHQILAALHPNGVNNAAPAPAPAAPPAPPAAFPALPDNGNEWEVLDEALGMGDDHIENNDAHFAMAAFLNHNQPEILLEDDVAGNWAVQQNLYHNHQHQAAVAAAAAAAAAGVVQNAWQQHYDMADNRSGIPGTLRRMLLARKKKREKNLRERSRANQMPHIGGTTPLHLATKNGHIDCIRELIMNGADYNMTDEQGRTSLYIAASRGDVDGVLTHLNNAVGRDILSLPVKDTNETPLHECVDHGMYQCVKELLLHGSDTNFRNNSGFSPLHLAVLNTEKFNFDIVRELVTNGYNTDVNLRDCACRTGKTPLQYVCFSDNSKQERRPQVAAFLIAYGAQFDTIKNKFGTTLLQQELRCFSTDRSILHAMVRTMNVLPRLECLGIWYSPQVQRLQPVPAEKCAWYQSLRNNPRTLQHLCRCTVRQSLGIPRLRHIPKLPLPTTLKEYLLLECDTLR